jgi:hypothetical protein
MYMNFNFYHALYLIKITTGIPVRTLLTTCTRVPYNNLKAERCVWGHVSTFYVQLNRSLDDNVLLRPA